MPPTRVLPLDYTSRDQESIRADMSRSIGFFTPEWTDRNNSDFGIVLLNLFAGQMDVVHFYIDRMAAESYLPTAVKRESVIKLLRLIGFELRPITPASVDVTFTLAAALSEAVLIPEGTAVQTVASEDQVPIIFETSADVTIPALSLTATIGAFEGEADEEDIGTSNGLSFQPFILVTEGIVAGSLDILIDEGAGEVPWTRVASFVNSLATDEHYREERDENNVVTIFFGDNLQGKIPVSGATLRGTFSTITGDRGGPGVFGNVGANTITILNSTIFASGRTVTLAVNNAEQASGGEDRQSVEEAKRLGPASLLALNRAVTVGDYKTLVEQLGGVAKARVTQGTSSDSCCACNLEVVVAPAGGGNPSQALKDTISDFLDLKKMVGTCIEIKDPEFVSVDVTGTVFLVSNVDAGTSQGEALTSLDDLFALSNPNTDFGGDLFLGNVFATLENVDGVDHVDLTVVTRKPVPKLVTWTGDAAFGPITLSQSTGEEDWTLTYLSATTFSVVGSVSGVQVDGIVGALYLSDNSEISFLLSAGATPNALGDVATFTTSKILGNVPISDTQIVEKGTVALTFAVIPGASTGLVCA